MLFVVTAVGLCFFTDRLSCIVHHTWYIISSSWMSDAKPKSNIFCKQRPSALACRYMHTSMSCIYNVDG